MVTYVALLMLLQLGLAAAEATFFSALLFVPWVLKSFMRPWVSRVGHFRQMIHLIEALLFICLGALAFTFDIGPTSVFLALLLVSLLSAWHELTARMYYERMLRPAFQRLFVTPKLVCSQVSVIFTYGALIFLVGTLEVYFRQIRYSWSLASYVAAGIFLFFFLLHLGTLTKGQETRDKGQGTRDKGQGTRDKGQETRDKRQGTRDDGRGRGFDSTASRRLSVVGCWSSVLVLFLLLLPQALMFHARVLYLFDAQARGGLQCTMQEIGFAQGTVGVIAFSIGIAMGRRLIARYTLQRLFWPLAVCVVLSPFVYLGMTICPPQSLLPLCCCTMTAQLLFGLGLGICRLPISAISGTRYRNTISMLQIPLVSAAMIVPMALSGWMVEQLGYNTYFLVNALSAPVCLLGVYLLMLKR